MIGKVAVKVYPDTSEFADDLRNDLNRIERNTEVLVPIKLDPKNLRAELQKMQQLLRENPLELKIALRFETATVKAEAKKLNAELQKSFEDIRIGTNLSDVLADRLGKINVKLNVSDSEIKKLKKRIEDGINPINVQLQPNVSGPSGKLAQAQLARLSRSRIVTLIPVVSKAAATKAATVIAALSGARLTGKLLTDLQDLFKNLDKNLPKIAAAAAGLLGLGGAALSASANLFSLSKELAQIGPAALALPGILGGVAIGFLITGIAMKDFNKQIPSAVTGWESLKKTVRSNFWDKALKPIRQLGQELFPALKRGIAAASTELGGFFGKFADSLRTELGGNPLKNMFDDLSKSIKIASGGTTAYARIISILGEQGARQLPRLARYFVDITDKFSDFLNKAQKDGSLQSWIDLGILRMRQLGRAVYQTSRFFAGLAKAANAAGGTTLDSWGDSFKRAADAVNRPGFQKALIGTLTAADQMMTNIAKVSGPGFTQFFTTMANTLQGILPTIGDTIGNFLLGVTQALAGEGFQSGLTKFFQDLKETVANLKPAFEPIANALGSMLRLAGAMGKAFSPAIATVLTTLSDAFVAMEPALSSIVKQLGGKFAQFVKDIAPSIKSISEKAGPALQAVADVIDNLVTNLTPDIAKTLDKISAFMGKKIDAATPERIASVSDSLTSIGKLVFGSLNDVIDFFDWLSTPKAGDAKSALEGFVTTLGDLANSAIKAKNGLKEVLGLINAIRDMKKGQSNWDEFTNFVKSVGSDLGTSVDTGGLGEEGGKKWTAGFGRGLLGLGKILSVPFSGLWNDSDIEGTIPNFAKKVGGKFKSVFTKKFWKDAFTFDESWGKAFEGKTVGTVFSDLGTKVKDGIAKAFTWDGKAIDDFFTKMGTSIKDWLLKPVDFSGLGESITTGLNTFVVDSIAWDTLLGPVGGFIIDGLVNGFDEAVYKVRDWLQQLTEWIPTWKGPAATDSTLLTPAGEAIIRSLIAGFQNVVGEVFDWLQGLTEGIVGFFTGVGGFLFDTGKALGQSLADGLRAAAGATTAAGRAIASAARSGAAGVPFAGTGSSLGRSLASGVRNTTGINAQAGNGLANAARRGASGVSLVNTGYNLGRGLAAGMNRSLGLVRDAANRMIAEAERAANAAAIVQSPSKLFAQIGSYIGQGLAMGIEAETQTVASAMESLVDAASGVNFSPVVGLGVTKADIGKVSKTVTSNARDNSSSAGATTPTRGGAVFNITNNNPVAEPASVTATRALRLAGSMELV